MGSDLSWRDAAAIELVPGYYLTDANGERATSLTDVRTACEGGYLHVAVPDSPVIQIISAPALRRITYQA